MPETVELAVHLPSQLATSLQKWRQSLLDLSRRNRLLYFKPSASNIKISLPDLYTIVDELDGDGVGWNVYQANDTEEVTPEEGQEPVDIDEHEDQSDLIVFDEKSAKTLRRKLTNVSRRFLSDQSDRGVHVLYIAAGLLEWQETGTKESIHSPLILFPVTLTRKSIFSPWQLNPADDEEILVNPALQHKMQKLGLSIPDLPPADEADRCEGGQLCRKYFDQLREQINSVNQAKNWKILEEAWLGIFSFHKLVMFADLEQNKSKVGESLVLRAVSGLIQPQGAFGDPAVDIDRNTIDALFKDKESFHVVDADSSQLSVLEAVNRGSSIALQGPPGTGKSQTITNIIAQAIGSGKTILFVSEKMAALDVVRNRLERTQLMPLCLELHSHKANKREVIRDLADALLRQIELDEHGSMRDSEFFKLKTRRDSLNHYVHELHLIREPFRRSVASVLGELANLSDANLCNIPEKFWPRITDLAPEEWAHLQDIAARIASRWRVIEQGEKMPWFGAIFTPYTGLLHAAIHEEHSVLTTAVCKAYTISCEIAKSLNLSLPTVYADVRKMIDLLRIITDSPGIPSSFFKPYELSIGDIIRQFRERYERFNHDEQAVTDIFGNAIPTEEPNVVQYQTDLASLEHAFNGTRLRLPEPNKLPELKRKLNELRDAIRLLIGSTRIVETTFGLQGQPITMPRLRILLLLVENSIIEPGIDRVFLEPVALRKAKALLSERIALWSKANQLIEETGQYFLESIIELDLQSLLDDFRSRYTGWTKIFKPAYYSSRRVILARSRPEIRQEKLITLLELALETKKTLSIVNDQSEEDPRVFGSFARGRHTNEKALTRAIQNAEVLLTRLPDVPFPDLAISYLTSAGILPSQVRSVCEKFVRDLNLFTNKLHVLNFSQVTHIDALGNTVDLVELTDLASWGKNIAEALSRIETAIQSIPVDIANQINLQEIGNVLESHAHYLKLRNVLKNKEDSLRHILGPDFKGQQTDWTVLERKEAYYQLIEPILGDRKTDPILHLIAQSKPVIPLFDDLCIQVTEADQGLTKLRSRFDASYQKVGEHGYEDTPIDLLVSHSQRLADNIDALRDLMDVEESLQELNRRGFREIFELFLKPTYTPEHFGRALRKTVLQCWIDSVIQSCPALRDFRRKDHEKIIQEYKTLDYKLWQTGTHRIYQQYVERQPDKSANGGEMGILRREAEKRRRHMPLRKLFHALPTLIPRLKPCLLMSPLSVAQFLKDSPIMFDLVIFDEASQICTEDAVGAIMRGRQVVVCGDEKQLPPTAFFQMGFGLGDEEEDEEEDFAEYESILAACRTCLHPAMLKWHYRSRHESLIAFSNSRFYDYLLKTFPCSTHDHPDLGVKFVYVENGVYDTGRTRTNNAEAERIVDLVFDHWSRFGLDKSLGVVTLSISQMEKVYDCLSERLKQRPDCEKFTQSVSEPFFIKNLENVQGDERDHIIFGIGYGRNRNGQLSMNFGPINKNGGERRLNVAITRARERIVLAASIRYTDLNVTWESPAGVRHLQKYLEYAERGSEALESAEISRRDTDSPLEDSILGYIRSQGYEALPQVGCSGFRIDIGVKDPANPGRFLLGVECDGATYHSTRSARDRDRLRQGVLEGLGWTIYRIWGPEWVNHRKQEENCLLEMLRSIRTVRDGNQFGTPREDYQKAAQIRIVENAEDGNRTMFDVPAFPSWAKPFIPTNPSIPFRLRRNDPDQVSGVDLAEAFASIARKENGVHFDRALKLIQTAWPIGRMTKRLRQYMEDALQNLSADFRYDQNNNFILPKNFTPEVRIPKDNPSDGREVSEVPPPELELALLQILRNSGLIDRNELCRSVCALYGKRATQKNCNILNTIIDVALSSGMLRMVDSRVGENSL